jgi:hypothetical protein
MNATTREHIGIDMPPRWGWGIDGMRRAINMSRLWRLAFFGECSAMNMWRR